MNGEGVWFSAKVERIWISQHVLYLEGIRIPIFFVLLINGVVSSLEGAWEGFFTVRLSKLFLERCAPNILQ